MKYLLDTDHLSILQRRRGAECLFLSARLKNVLDDDLAASLVSLHEQMMGCHAYLNRSKNSGHLVDGYSMMKAVYDTFASLTVLEFDQQSASSMDRLPAAQIRIGAMDLRIAATALSRSLTLLTRNSKDFSRIPGLAIEDWTK